MTSSNQISRREALGIGLGATLLTGGLLRAENYPTTFNIISRQPARNERPRSVIFMVADGMSLGVPTLAEPFSRILRGKGTNYCEILRDTTSVRSLVDMASADSLVPDSASAASSWGSGQRVNNGAINVTPDGQALTPITRLVRQTGRRTALVTTTRITNATPAGFAVSIPERRQEYEIASRYLQEEVDLLLGGGLQYFDPNLRADQRDLTAEFRAAGYTIYQTRRQLLENRRQPPERMLGLFANSHLSYTIDQLQNAALQQNVPTLAEMSRAALESLANHSQGFIIQIEGGRIDHAAHANDAAAMLHDQLAFDDAIGVVREFQAAHPETLVIITTDHSTANPGLNGIGTRYTQSTNAFEKIALAKASYSKLFDALRARRPATATPDDISEVVTTHLGITLRTTEANAILETLNGELPAELSRQHRNRVGIVGQILGNHHGIGWTGITHTADFALLAAFGPGRQQFEGLKKNVDIFGELSELLNLPNNTTTKTNS